MAALDFPSSPTVGQLYTANSLTWQWDGVTWVCQNQGIIAPALVSQGGTGATDAATARTNLGLAIGANVQAWDGDLDAIAAISGTSGILKKTAANTWSLDTNAYLTGNQSISISGDASGSGTTSISLTLATVPVTKGGTGATTLTGLLKGNGTSAFTAAVAGTDYQSPIGTISGIVKGNGANALTAAVAGTDYLAPGNSTAMGGGTDKAFWVNDQAITTDYTVASGKNAGTFGPVTINAGITVTVSAGSVWSIV